MTATVIVPTFNEGPNAESLLRRLDAALVGRDVDVLFVDDGADDLPEIVAAVAPSLRLPVRVVRRAEPVGRLGGAVVAGIGLTDSEVVVVCDGDLQHPPELIPELLDQTQFADVVVASRYVAGGKSDGLANPLRVFVSHASGALSRLVLPERIRACSDPMSGFFAVRRSAIDVSALKPDGFKILLEMLVRGRPASVREVPFTFAERTAGESHAGALEGFRFLAQLVRLRLAMSPTASKALRFGLVGASGVLPNLVAVWLLELTGMAYLVAAVLAIQISILWNFAGAELVVWRHTIMAGARRHRFARFAAIGETDLLRLPFVVLLVEFAHLATTLATAITLVLAFCARFVLADRFVYRHPRPAAAVEPAAALAAESVA